MSKKPRRRIVIDGRAYGYVIGPIRHPEPGWVRVSLWSLDARGQKLRVAVRFDDPWSNYGPLLTASSDRIEEVFEMRPVTPGLVRAIIEHALGAGWTPEAPGRELRRSWDRAAGAFAPET